MDHCLDAFAHRLSLDVHGAPRPDSGPTLPPSEITADGGHIGPLGTDAQDMPGSGVAEVSTR